MLRNALQQTDRLPGVIVMRVVVGRIGLQRCIGCLSRLSSAGCLAMMMLGGSVLVMVVAIGMLVVVMVVSVMAGAGRCPSENRSGVAKLLSLSGGGQILE